MARGLNECERRSGGVPRCTVAVTALSPSRSASRLRSTPRTMGECWPCSTGSRAWAVAPNAGSKSPASGCVWVSARQEYSRQHLALAVAAQCSIVGPQLLLHRVDGLLRRLYSIHFASAFMHVADRTLVALCADIRACGAAMPAAVSLVATWAAEHILIISADRRGRSVLHRLTPTV
ncbi:hypothetical protein TcYC6_0047500 [Trypanosoma cruzi]|nr:hypothetical protein TcYC6_0047500 [Trypanosoma cruzi]